MQKVKPKKIILMIEDETLFRETTAARLRDNGFEVIEAKEGKEGLEKALTQKPDLILLDIIMSGMDGIKVLKKLREDTWGVTAQVIMLTNANDSVKAAEAMELGVFDYLIKSSCEFHHILRKVKHVTGAFTK